METAQIAMLLPALAFGSAFLLVYGLQQVFDRRAARLSRHLGRFAPSYPGVADINPDFLRGRQRYSRIGGFDRFLHRQAFAERMAQDLTRSAIPLRVGEYLATRWLIALSLGGLAGLIGGGPLAIIPAAIAGYFLPVIYLRYRQRRRLDQINEQLVDALVLIGGGLRAGYSFLQGVEAVVRELPPPIGVEFKIILEDLGIGTSLDDALRNLAQRVPLEDVDMVVTAMLIQRSSGGNLAEVLDNIALTIRERMRIRREIRTLTAQQRLSCYVVGALPFFAVGFLTFTNLDYVRLLFTTPHGLVMLVAAIVLETVGFLLMRRIINISL